MFHRGAEPPWRRRTFRRAVESSVGARNLSTAHGRLSPLLEFSGMAYNPVDDLRRDIANGDVLVVVGTGVSLAATGGKPNESVASWQGLLLNGVDRCEGLDSLSRSKAAKLRAAIHSGNLDRLLDAAGEVRKALRGSDDSEVRIWLRDTVGQLKSKDRELLEAIRDLGLPIATTNYDDLLEEVTGWRPVTWMDGDRAIRASQGKEKFVLHLHGHWSKLESVILDRESYDRIRSHDLAQTILRGARAFKTLLFVGCGDGLSDPNFGALLEWAREVFRGMEGRHYRLCLKSEAATLKKLHREDHILPVHPRRRKALWSALVRVHPGRAFQAACRPDSQDGDLRTLLNEPCTPRGQRGNKGLRPIASGDWATSRFAGRITTRQGRASRRPFGCTRESRIPTRSAGRWFDLPDWSPPDLRREGASWKRPGSLGRASRGRIWWSG